MHKDARQLVEHFFRHEYGRIVSLLTHSLGIRQLDLAEDVVQSALSKALITWGRKGVPENPGGWLYRTARNSAIDALRRDQLARETFARNSDDLAPDVCATTAPQVSDEELGDETLRLLFLCSHPSISLESRIAFALKTVGGFSVDEIASALLVNRDSAEKRITRTKHALKEIGQEIADLDPKAMVSRIEAVESTIYLIFSEGYATSHGDLSIRKDLCDEAIRLARMLNQWLTNQLQHGFHRATPSVEIEQSPNTSRNNELTAHSSSSFERADAFTHAPSSAALLALMLFHSARLDTRVDEFGCDVLMSDQNRRQWNWDTIREAMHWMQRSASGSFLTRYHLEAAIAWEHCRATDLASVDWAHVVSLYRLLEQIAPGPMIRLNVAIAESYAKSATEGLSMLEKIVVEDRKRLRPWWDCAIADVYIRLGRAEPALAHLLDALALANSVSQKALIEKKIAQLTLAEQTQK